MDNILEEETMHNMLRTESVVLRTFVPGSGATGIIGSVPETISRDFFTGSKNLQKNIKSLAEAIILQSMEDLWDPAHKEDSILFFKGEGFRSCAEISGISWIKQFKMLKMLADAGSKISPLTK